MTRLTSTLHRTAWLSPPEHRKGQDHLAVQAVGVNIYGQLVPGLTNVTDRISYYSFYPWLLWAYKGEGGTAGSDDFVEILRRAECAVGLIASLHALEDGDEDGHVRGLTGRRRLEPAARTLGSGEKLRLSDFASLVDGESRYFKNRLGGLGQYYFGPLRQVGVLAGETRNGIQFTGERGGFLAGKLESHVDRKAFFRMLRGDLVDARKLKAFGGLCPCRLASNRDEREALRDWLLNRPTSPLHDDLGEARRGTIALLLDVIAALPEDDEPMSADALARRFRDASYAAALPGMGNWPLGPALSTLRDKWAVYQRHELLSLAVQGLFWAGLAELQINDLRPASADAYGAWFARRFAGHVEDGREGSLTGALERFGRQLPPVGKADEPRHELRAADRLMDAVSQAEPEVAVSEASAILLALLARGSSGGPYEGLEFPRGYFDIYEINLPSLRRHAGDTWATMSVPDWLSWLASRWGILTHLRVGLRKLHHESLETFRIVLEEAGLRVVELPDVSWTGPRLVPLLRMMVDVGLLDGTFRATETGAAVRKELHEGG